MIVGTVRYMPPEQAMGHPQVTPAADVYGLGSVLLYAATAHHPYDGARWEAIVSQVANPQQSPDLSGVPASLLPVISPMLGHDPDDRPTLGVVTGRCTELLSDLRLTAVQARHALIDRTAPPHSSRPQPAERAVVLGTEDYVSPLDGPSDAHREPQDDTPMEIVLEEEGHTAPEPPDAGRVRGGRVPASQRVAEELRRQYAAQAAL